MKRLYKRGLGLTLFLIMLLSLSVSARTAVSDHTLELTLADTAQYVCERVKSPQVGSIGGEWAVLGLARSGSAVPETYYQDYYAAVERYVQACGGQLHDKKYTEYSRVILALSAIGKDARDVAGYDLTLPLGDYEKTIWQGLNGPVWALIALDSRDYPVPENPQAQVQATRQMYIDRILECQLSDGGWSLLGGSSADISSDPDITGMALQALAKYQEQPAVAQAIETALTCVSSRQDSNGGFSSWGTRNSESCIQMIVALCELGIPLDDPRFVKNGNTMLDDLMTFYQPGEGFLHTADGSGSSQMASEQALYGLAAVQRAREGRNSLYRMGDAAPLTGEQDDTQKGEGLAGKHAAVQAVPLRAPGKTFDDIAGGSTHRNQIAIEALAARGIINGKADGLFHPEDSMTRAEFAALVVRSLGLTPQADDRFSDVNPGEWFSGYAGTACAYGIIQGVGADRFCPGGTITRQEAAVMAARAAELCGMEPSLDGSSVRDVLAQFPDYISTADWALQGVAFCYRAELLDQSELEIRPLDAIKRCEAAQMLYTLLTKANLL